MADRRTNEVIDEESSTYDKASWKPFLRQIFISSGIWTASFITGLYFGAPTVLIPQIRREANSTAAISDEMASWLSSATSMSAFSCITISAIASTMLGRKISYMIACIIVFIASLVFFCSTSIIQILISEIMCGLFIAASMVIADPFLSECLSPRYRGTFLGLKSASFNWGVWVANAIGTFFHWKKICLVVIICTAYLVTIVFIWPESPFWLASKERYKECAASHRWLKGCDVESEKELENLIHRQKQNNESRTSKKLSTIETVQFWYATIISPDFYKPSLITLSIGLLAIFSGKYVCAVYILDIIKKITSSESTAYTGMLILDGVIVASMYVQSILTKFVKRRQLLLITSSFEVLLIYSLSLYLYLISKSVISENTYVTLGLLVVYSITVSCGSVIAATVSGEMLPLRSRYLAVFLILLISKFFFAVTLKIAPFVFKKLELHGGFLVFALSFSTVLLILYKYLPETKDKTLQEIMDIVKGETKLIESSLEESNKLVVPKGEIHSS